MLPQMAPKEVAKGKKNDKNGISLLFGQSMGCDYTIIECEESSTMTPVNPLFSRDPVWWLGPVKSLVEPAHVGGGGVLP